MDKFYNMKIMKFAFLISQIVVGILYVLPGNTYAQEVLLFDQGPHTGVDNGCWSNFTDGQNFAEQIKLPKASQITALNIYTCIGWPGGESNIKIMLDDGSGNPNTRLTDWNQWADSWLPFEDIFVAHYEFPPVDMAAEVTYWIGVSGNGWEHGLTSVQTPGDGTMAQFSGRYFSFHTDVGDQMFEVFGNFTEREDILFDQGPATGSDGGCWANDTFGQNFADHVILENDAQMTGLNIYTCIGYPSNDSHIKILADDGYGNPGAVITEWDQSATSWTQHGAIYVAFYEFPKIDLAANTIYWIGVSGNSFEHGQTSIQTPGDGLMAQFSGSSFSWHTNVGDQMFQVLGYSFGNFNLEITGDCNSEVEIKITGGVAGAKCGFAWGTVNGSTQIPSCPGLYVDIKYADAWRSYPDDVLFINLDGNGDFVFNKAGGAALCGKIVQVVDIDNCVVSNVIVIP